MQTTQTPAVNGTAKKSRAKATQAKWIKIKDVRSSTDADGREVLAIDLLGVGVETQIDIPFINATATRMKKLCRMLIGRKLMQTRPDINVFAGRPKSEFIDIAPYEALMLLARNYDNRGLRFERTEQYAHEMRTDRWEPTCQGLGFDTDGKMLNGQHTCWAAIMADVTIPTLFVTGLAPSAKSKIDTQAVRSNACLLELDPGNLDLKTLPSAPAMNAILLRIFMLVAGSYKSIWNGNKDNLGHMIRKYKRALQWLKAGGFFSAKGVTRDFTKAPIVAGYVLFHAKFPEQAEEFLNTLFFGSLKERKSNPAIASLYDYLEDGRFGNKTLVKTDTPVVQTHRVLRAAKAYVEGEKIESASTKGFPKTLEGRDELLAFFSPKGDKRKLVPPEIDLESFETMMKAHTARMTETIEAQVAALGNDTPPAS